jgi:hypothetical protein
MKGASLGPISYKNDFLLKEVVWQYLNIIRVAGQYTNLIKKYWAISHNMKKPSVGPISYKTILIEFSCP